ncbi:hypothetical protein WR25_04512 isoform B [Diploscapter pachys]|uniref:Uncharacterized protein n=1 Tax=Diploscapter pachys TaxID=2018661 RepID=A0A2A2LFX5_9BILA|nr:hypothetical protein WR25_04512 isoform A [Diploscapter pachys]PAV85093.1 hypothetical protein WR25_04512 isoform B [Diploscapter pachys]
MRFLLIVAISLVFILVHTQDSGFVIPLPFGGLNIKKTEDGKTEIDANGNLNIFGWGAKKDFKIVTGNGTFDIKNKDTAIVNNTDFGLGGDLGVDKSKGISNNVNLTLGDQTSHGGVGKETNFIEELIKSLQNLGSTTPKP